MYIYTSSSPATMCFYLFEIGNENEEKYVCVVRGFHDHPAYSNLGAGARPIKNLKIRIILSLSQFHYIS